MDRAAQVETLIRWLYRLSPGEIRIRLSTLRPRVRRSLAEHWIRGEVARLDAIDEVRAQLPPATDPLHVALNTIASRMRDEFPLLNRGGCGIISRILLEELVTRRLDLPSLRYVFYKGTDRGPLHVLLCLSDGYLYDTDYGVHRWDDRVDRKPRELRVNASSTRLFIFDIQASEFVRRQIRLGFPGVRSYESLLAEMQKVVTDELCEAMRDPSRRSSG